MKSEQLLLTTQPCAELGTLRPKLIELWPTLAALQLVETLANFGRHKPMLVEFAPLLADSALTSPVLWPKSVEIARAGPTEAQLKKNVAEIAQSWPKRA